ncbi:MAG: GatB/YqeY domain-containing protein [Patescibacteria group bacterium]
MGLKEKLEQDAIAALKGRESEKVSTLRMVISAIKNEAIAKRKELTEEEVLSVVAREIKKRKESAEAYEKGGRKDLSLAESAEVALLGQYLPEPLSEAELEKMIKEVIQETGAESIKDMGKVIGQVMAKVQGKAEGKVVSEKVRQLLV